MISDVDNAPPTDATAPVPPAAEPQPSAAARQLSIV